MTQCGAPKSDGRQDLVAHHVVSERPSKHARAIGTPDGRDLLDPARHGASSAREWIRLC